MRTVRGSDCWNDSDFDIDVDLGPMFQDVRAPILVNSRWYELALPADGRAPEVQASLDGCLERELLRAQWEAMELLRQERRGARRAPILRRLQMDGERLLACDISSTGLRASGRPTRGLIDFEFNLPGLDFPVDARAEVIDFKDKAVIPLVNLRFVDLDRPYREHIDAYVSRKLTA